MANVQTIQGRAIGESDLDLIGGLLGTYPDWHRTRNDRARRIQAPVKDVCLYPLVNDFREALGAC